MIRRIHRCLPCLGAVAALLLPALPLQADEIEPEPYVEEEMAEPEPEPEVVAEPEVEPEVEEAAAPEEVEEPTRNIEKFFDLVIVRPLYFSRLVIGLPFFVFYPFTIASGYDVEVVALLWTEPYQATFERPLGEAPEDY
jgi:hypothetical protein